MENKYTVLIVEDEGDLRMLLREKLKSEGFSVIEAENGEVGLKTALEKHPDIVLLDIIMPVMDGLSMLKQLRQDEWGKNVPAVILSNLNEAEKVSESLEKNVYDYLVKADWEPDDVVNLVRKKLNITK